MAGCVGPVRKGRTAAPQWLHLGLAHLDLLALSHLWVTIVFAPFPERIYKQVIAAITTVVFSADGGWTGL